MTLLKMDALFERSRSTAEMRADSSGTLSEAEVRELSKSLASLRVKNDDTVNDDFLRFETTSTLNLNSTYSIEGMCSRSFKLC